MSYFNGSGRRIVLTYKKEVYPGREEGVYSLAYTEADREIAFHIKLKEILLLSPEDLLRQLDPNKTPTPAQLQNAKFYKHVLQPKMIKKILTELGEAGGYSAEFPDERTNSLEITIEVKETKAARVDLPAKAPKT